MKRIVILLFIILFICSACTNNHKINKFDCDEAGICAEGIEYTIDSDTFTVNKESCLKHNKKWNEELKACYMY